MLWPGAWPPLAQPPRRTRQQWWEACKSRRSATNNQSQLTMPAVPQMQAIPPGSPQSVCCLRSPRQTRHTAATQEWQATAQRMTKTITASYFGCGRGAFKIRAERSPTILQATLACVWPRAASPQNQDLHAEAVTVGPQGAAGCVILKRHRDFGPWFNYTPSDFRIHPTLHACSHSITHPCRTWTASRKGENFTLKAAARILWQACLVNLRRQRK